MILDSPPSLTCTETDVERWNLEWLDYLRQEWMYQLTPHTEFHEKPPLPADPMDLLELSVGLGWQLGAYCDRDALEDRRVMELGCGCGYLGKQIARYVRSYLGTDYSTMALQIARLVSPDNCTYIHLADREGFGRFAGQIDTVISRYFWNNQNLKLGRDNLAFLSEFLRQGGRVYADLFFPNPGIEHFVTFPADAPLSETHPSAQYWYTSRDILQLIAGLPFRVLRETISVARERRYVVLERQ